MDEWTKNLISICLDDKEEYLAASCQANVAVFDVARAIVGHVVPVHAISIALVTSPVTPILIAGDSEGNISLWSTSVGSNDFEEKKVRRRSKRSSVPTPFKIKAALDCSAVMVYNVDEGDAEEVDLELPELSRIERNESVAETIVEEDPAKNDSSGISSASFNSPRKDDRSLAEQIDSMIAKINDLSEADIKAHQKQIIKLKEAVAKL